MSRRDSITPATRHKILPIVLLLLSLPSCVYMRTNQIKFSKDVEKFRSEMQSLVPVGIPVEEAERILEKSGFYALQDEVNEQKSSIQFVKKNLTLGIQPEWTAVLEHKDGIVTDLHTMFGYFGPFNY